MMALWKHLKPPSNHSASVIRVLGKLGGRNRHFLQYGSKFVRICCRVNSQEIEDSLEHGLTLPLYFDPNVTASLPLDKLVAILKKKIHSPTEINIEVKVRRG